MVTFFRKMLNPNLMETDSDEGKSRFNTGYNIQVLLTETMTKQVPSCVRIHGTDLATTNSAWSARQEERETAGGQAAPMLSNVCDTRTTAPTMCQRSRRRTTTKGRAKARSECLARPSTTANQGTRVTREDWTMPAIGEGK